VFPNIRKIERQVCAPSADFLMFMQHAHFLCSVLSSLDRYELTEASQYLECLKWCCSSFDDVIRRNQASFAPAQAQPASNVPHSEQNFVSRYKLFVDEKIVIVESKLVQTFDELLLADDPGNLAPVELFAGALSAHNQKSNFDGKVKMPSLYLALATRLTTYCNQCISLAAQYLGEDSSEMVENASKQLQNVDRFLQRFESGTPFVSFSKIQAKYNEQEMSLEFAKKQFFQRDITIESSRMHVCIKILDKMRIESLISLKTTMEILEQRFEAKDADVNRLMNTDDIPALSLNDLTCIWDFFCSLLQLKKHPLILAKSGNEKINRFVQSADKRLFYFLDKALVSCKSQRVKFHRPADLKQFIRMLREDILESVRCQEFVCVCEYVQKCEQEESQCQVCLETLQSKVTEFSEFDIFSFDQNLLSKLSQTLSRLEKSDRPNDAQVSDDGAEDDDPLATNSYQSLVNEICRKFTSFRAQSRQPGQYTIKVEWTCEGQKESMRENFRIASLTVADLIEAVACKLVLHGKEKILMPEDPQFFFLDKEGSQTHVQGPSLPDQNFTYFIGNVKFTKTSAAKLFNVMQNCKALEIIMTKQLQDRSEQKIRDLKEKLMRTANAEYEQCSQTFSSKIHDTWRCFSEYFQRLTEGQEKHESLYWLEHHVAIGIELDNLLHESYSDLFPERRTFSDRFSKKFESHMNQMQSDLKGNRKILAANTTLDSILAIPSHDRDKKSLVESQQTLVTECASFMVNIREISYSVPSSCLLVVRDLGDKFLKALISESPSFPHLDLFQLVYILAPHILFSFATA
jgi:hypothetical protein